MHVTIKQPDILQDRKFFTVIHFIRTPTLWFRVAGCTWIKSETIVFEVIAGPAHLAFTKE